MLFKIAWRNLWRNRRRTLITMATVIFAVILSTLMMSLKEGTYNNMIDAMIGAYTGYAQLQTDVYYSDKKIDNAFPVQDSLRQLLEAHRNVTGYSTRIESFALAASEKVTRGVMVIGVEPSREATQVGLDGRVIQGTYFTEDDQEVLLGDGLAEYLRLAVGDTLILLGQGYRGSQAVGKYRVQGIVKFGSPDLSKRLVFLPIRAAQQLYDTDGLFTNVVLSLDDESRSTPIARKLQNQMPDGYSVLPWEELVPDLRKMIETDRAEGYVFMFILYMVISFGIFGTMLMMLAERRHEFGVMIAVGLKRRQLGFVIWIELILVSIAGAIGGMLGAFPVCAYFYLKPIEFSAELGSMMEDYGMEAVLQSSIEPGIFLQQAAVILVIASVIAIYPFLKLARLNAIKAMKP